jgi:hypothetical protein
MKKMGENSQKKLLQVIWTSYRDTKLQTSYKNKSKKWNDDNDAGKHERAKFFNNHKFTKNQRI